MYLPSHFEETRAQELYGVIREYPLGALVTHGAQGLDANHVPFHLDEERRVLLAHVARANPIWREIKDGDEVLVIFRAGDAYVSPNWYPGKHEHHRLVPTWNYRVVHVHGRATVRDDERFVRGVVARLTRTHEARVNGEQAWRMTDSPQDYIDQMVAAIVGIEVDIVRIAGKWKLSQNREARDRINAAEELRKRDEQVISAAMLDVGK